MIDAAAAGKLGALYVVSEDPHSSYPDRSRVEAALGKVPFLVVQDLFLSPTAAKAHVVLPATSFAEKDGTFTNAERRIQRVRRGIPSPGEAKTDYAIFELLAARFGQNLSYTGPAAVFAEIVASSPDYAGLDYAAIGAQGLVWGGETLVPRQRKLQGVAGAKAVSGGSFQLVTGSALYHSGTVSTRASGPQAALPAAYVELSREDAKGLGVLDGEVVTVKGSGVELKLKVKVGNRLPRGVVFVPYHFAEAGINKIYKGESAVAVEIAK
jgi:predicted molibdopterin-dependent oxidoreductase YjgC